MNENEEKVVTDYEWTEEGMAKLLNDSFDGEMKYCPANKRWYIWNGKIWQKHLTSSVVIQRWKKLKAEYKAEYKEIIAQQPAEMRETSAEASFSKFLTSLGKTNTSRNIAQSLAVDSEISLDEFDTYPYILNTPNGMVDLLENKVLPHDKGYYITTTTNAAIADKNNITCDRWYQFIDDITQGDKEKAEFLQRALGYSLLGDNKQECLFVLHGKLTRNGKGTLFAAIDKALGEDYFKQSDTRLICQNRKSVARDPNAPTQLLNALVGSRIVVMSEVQRGSEISLDVGYIKSLTGRDLVPMRGMYVEGSTFLPQFTIWLALNHLPTVKDNSLFTSHRIWVIELNNHFSEENGNLDTNLKTELCKPENLPTVLHWLLKGCRDYITQGLNPPDSVREATLKYRMRDDRVASFLAECCNISDGVKTKPSELYSAFKMWCVNETNRFKISHSSVRFYSELETLGYQRSKTKGIEYFRRIGLKSATQPPEE